MSRLCYTGWLLYSVFRSFLIKKIEHDTYVFRLFISETVFAVLVLFVVVYFVVLSVLLSLQPYL